MQGGTAWMLRAGRLYGTTALQNRSGFEHPTDGWYQVEAAGDHPNTRAGVVQVIDREAIERIVGRFNAEAAAPGFPGMLIDHEHFKYDTSKETTAYGWLMELQNRESGIYGRIKWTATGQTAVDGGDYRFFSTEYNAQDLVVLNSGTPAWVRPVRLGGLTLTNEPNNKGCSPITNRNGGHEEQGMEPCKVSRGASLDVGWMAADGLRRLAEDEKRRSGSSFMAAWETITNRNPNLKEFAELRRNWDALKDLEPVAHLVYGDYKNDLNALINDYPDSHNLVKILDYMIEQYPDLGYEGRWQKAKEDRPDAFWGFVLSFSDAETKSRKQIQQEREREHERILQERQRAQAEAQRQSLDYSEHDY